MQDVSVHEGPPSIDVVDLLSFDGASSPTVILSPGTAVAPHKGFRDELCYAPPGEAPIPSLRGAGYTSEAIALRAFRNAVLDRRHGLICDAGGQYVKESTCAVGFQDPHWRGAAARAEAPGSMESVDFRLLYSLHGNYGVFSHFIFETACTAHLARSLLLDGSVAIVMPPDFAAFASRVLDALEVPGTARHRAQARHIECRHLVVSSTCSGSVTYQPNVALREVARALLQRWGAGQSGPKRLYLTRTGYQNTGIRDYREDLELAERLSAFDFVAVNPGTLDFVDQIALFANAEIIVGPHGSGFANAIFAPAGCLVLDILPSHWAPIGGLFTANLTNLCEQ
jgi:hypothetical protein